MGIQYPALAEFRRIAEANTAAGNIPARSKPKPSLYYKKPPEFPTNWTAERKDRLTKLWDEGLSASEIATKLGEVTRNAVIGMVHRLGLPGRRTTHRAQRPSRALKTPRINIPFRGNTATNPPAQILVPVLPQPDLGPAPEGAITLANINELTDTMCHWPMGDPLKTGFHYCGRRKSRDASYCEHHAAIAYRPSSRKPKSKGKNGFIWLDLSGRNARNGGAA